MGNTNNTGKQIPVSAYVYVKGHSSVAEGLYTIKNSAVPNGASIDSSNLNIAASSLDTIDNRKFANYTTTIITFDTNTFSWEASEDCFIVAELTNQLSSGYNFTVDGVSVLRVNGKYASREMATLFIKRGQTIAVNSVSGANAYVRAFKLL